jgi:beta-galactosidase
MKQKLQKGWAFQEWPLASYEDRGRKAQPSLFKDVTLPHDYMIEDPEKFHESSEAYYRYVLAVEAEDLNKTHYLYFEGVYMESVVYVNGLRVGGNNNGYMSFYCDISQAVKAGDNEILVHVVNMQPNSRWYSGAGIYRDVWYIVKERAHIEPDSFFYGQSFTGPAHAGVRLTLGNEIVNPDCLVLSQTFRLLDQEGKEVWSYSLSGEKQISVDLEDYRLWSIEDPYLYTLEADLIHEGKILDREEVRLGIRKIEITTDQGFFLNDQSVELKGVCLHHDLGGLGAKFLKTAARRNLQIMQDMGVNAIRTSHNPFAPEFLDLCDEMGLLVIDECLDMWRMGKNTYDYARFFDEDVAQDVTSWVRRDLMHPCVVMWSVGNEIFDTHRSEEGRKTLAYLANLVRKADRANHAPVTLGSNFMAWENTRKCADDIKLIGYNYSERLYREDHEKHPDWVIYGSETGSLVQSRGIYHFPYENAVLADDDMQCSSLGNSTTSWGAKSIPFLLESKLENPFSLGQFLWAGIDYIGEPTPYHTKNAYFGMTDTAGFPKDIYYHFQAAWTDPEEKTVLHLYPYWDWNPGQTIDVLAVSNASSVELFLNGESLGRQDLDHAKAKVEAHWKVPFSPGRLLAKAYDAAGNILSQAEHVSPGDAAKLSLKPVYPEGHREGLIFLEIGALDRDGNPVANANNEIQLTVEGPGQRLYLNNGDSTDRTSYQSASMRLFSGKLLALVEQTGPAGKIKVCASSPELEASEWSLEVEASDHVPAVLEEAEVLSTTDAHKEPFIPCRKIDLRSMAPHALGPDQNVFTVEAKLLPTYARPQDITWRVTNLHGVDAPNAKLAVDPLDPLKARVEVFANGDLVVRATVTNGKDHADFISSLDFTAQNFKGLQTLNPYTFLSASLYSLSHGDVGNGNERGISMDREHMSWVAYENLDFGPDGSREISLPLFSLDDDNVYYFWKGVPYAEGSRMIGKREVVRPSIWNTYQTEHFTLDEKLIGIQTFGIEMRKKAHIKGFCFKEQPKAFDRLAATELKEIYGDSFDRTCRGIENIGNNVTIVLGKMDFGEEGSSGIHIEGLAHDHTNSIHLVFEREDERFVELLEFETEIRAKDFRNDKKKGAWKVSLLFLPGSDFDLYGLQFLADDAD